MVEIGGLDLGAARIGYCTGQLSDHTRRDWDGTQARPLVWSAWYPAAADGTPAPPAGSFFAFDAVVRDAPLAAGAPFPLILLSHGTGGTPESLGWLACHLVRAGFLVIGAHHHGNTGSQPYRAEGFLCWWERATDLTRLLTGLSETGPFSGHLDTSRAHAVGFSLGGYAVLALAGARSSMARYQAWAADHRRFARGPREFPEAAGQLDHLLKTSPVFQAAWARQSDDFSDRRLRSVIALAPAPTVRAFGTNSVKSISVPVTLITGEADEEAPSAECADWLASLHPGFRRISVGDAVGHYTFIGQPTGPVTADEAFLFRDNPGVDREAVHDRVADAVIAALRAV